jgi:hypothetical protein
MTTLTRRSEAVCYDEKISAISAYGPARSTIEGTPLTSDELRQIDAYWRATLYLCLGMLYLKENLLLWEPLKLEHTKPRVLGHWGSDAGQSFTYIHFNRLIKKYDLNANLHLRPRTRSACGLIERLPRRHVLRDISRKMSGRRWSVAFLQAIQFSGRDRKPRDP